MKMKYFLLITAVLSFFVSIAYRSQFAYYTNQAITYGVNDATIYRTNANISAVLTVLIGLVYIALSFIEKTKNADVQGLLPDSDTKENFEREIHHILSKLKLMAKDSEYENSFHSVNITIKQISSIVKYINRFNKLYIGESVDVIAGVAGSLDVAKGQFIQNSKSIANLIIVEGCEDEIEKRVINNQNIIEDVEILLSETVKYLDNKSTTFSSPLEGIISSLKTLNETIF